MEHGSEIIPIMIGAPVTVTEALLEGLEDLEIRGRVEITKTIVLWERPEY